jgi:formyltetrahydrofolate deformylase
LSHASNGMATFQRPSSRRTATSKRLITQSPQWTVSQLSRCFTVRTNLVWLLGFLDGSLRNGGNILHADQHQDGEQNIFFQRVEWSQPGNVAEIRRKADAFAGMAREKLGMTARLAISHEIPRVGALVSKIPHCLQDIVYRSQRGEIRGNLVCVMSNATDLQGFCAWQAS